MKKNKRGQFYLIAAIIIIAVIIGFTAISNYSKKRASIKLYDLGEELGIESENVLDYGTYNEFDENETYALLKDFIESYISYAEEKNLYFIFGNRDKITVIGYQELSEEVFIGGLPLIISEGTYTTQEFTPEGNKVIVSINGLEYEFKLKPGENFYFVISQEIGGEEYVVTG